MPDVLEDSQADAITPRLRETILAPIDVVQANLKMEVQLVAFTTAATSLGALKGPKTNKTSHAQAISSCSVTCIGKVLNFLHLPNILWSNTYLRKPSLRSGLFAVDLPF